MKALPPNRSSPSDLPQDPGTERSQTLTVHAYAWRGQSKGEEEFDPNESRRVWMNLRQTDHLGSSRSPRPPLQIWSSRLRGHAHITESESCCVTDTEKFP